MDGQQNIPAPSAQDQQARHAVPPVLTADRQTRAVTPTIAVDHGGVIHIHHQGTEVVSYTGLEYLLLWLFDNLSMRDGRLAIPPWEEKPFVLTAEDSNSSAQSMHRTIYENVEIKLLLKKTPPEVQIHPLACASMWARIEKGEGEKGTKLEIYWDNTAIYTGAREDDTGFYLQSKKAERRMFRLGFEGDVTRDCARHDPIVSEDIWGIILPNPNSAAGEDPHPSSKCPPEDGNIGRVVRVDERHPSLKEVQSRVGQSDLPSPCILVANPPTYTQWQIQNHRITKGAGPATDTNRDRIAHLFICANSGPLHGNLPPISKAPGTAPEAVYRCKMHMGSFPLGGKPEREFEDVFKIWPAKAGAKGEDKPLAWIKRDGELVNKLLGHAPEFFQLFLLGFGCRLQLLSESGKEREPDPHVPTPHQRRRQ
ncbi:hypothetical protein C8R47DRAFT_1260799 [Mycena vitilis]|nr:hypothetical protein C8R47DRAFT_1260799 [Mycena vitilis]